MFRNERWWSSTLKHKMLTRPASAIHHIQSSMPPVRHYTPERLARASPLCTVIDTCDPGARCFKRRRRELEGGSESWEAVISLAANTPSGWGSGW